jgi:hypothetical protein
MGEPERRAAAAEDLARTGARDAPIEIAEYDPAWPAMFETERARLAPLFGPVKVHHFGSTAVPRLAAKPVIDMIALVDDLDEAGELIVALKHTLAERNREDREGYTDAKALLIRRMEQQAGPGSPVHKAAGCYFASSSSASRLSSMVLRSFAWKSLSLRNFSIRSAIALRTTSETVVSPAIAAASSARACSSSSLIVLVVMVGLLSS